MRLERGTVVLWKVKLRPTLQPHELEPARLLRLWDFPGKNTGVGCHFLFHGIFLTQGWNLGLPHWRQTLYHLSHPKFWLKVDNAPREWATDNGALTVRQKQNSRESMLNIFSTSRSSQAPLLSNIWFLKLPFKSESKITGAGNSTLDGCRVF